MHTQSLIGLLGLLIITSSCNSNATTTERVSAVSDISSGSRIAEDNSSTSTSLRPLDVESFNNTIGKSPHSVRLLDSLLVVRLKKMMGPKFYKMIKNWNIEAPIDKQGDLLHATACKEFDCQGDSYDLFFDLKNNDLNVYNMSGKNLIIYKEKEAPIPLTGAYLANITKKKTDSNIAYVGYK